MVSLEQVFEPDPKKQQLYQNQYEQYRKLWPLMDGYLRNLSSTQQ